MDVANLTDTLDVEGRFLLEAARAAGRAAPVPSCPGWTVRDLVAHVGFVHNWAADYVEGGVTEMVAEPGEEPILALAPNDDSLFDWAADRHARLVRVLRGAPSDLLCWTFLPAPTPLMMWARRQAHETTVHRVDVEGAARRTLRPIEPAFALDGIDEILLAFLARRRSRENAPPVGVIALDVLEPPTSRTIVLHRDAIEASLDDRPADLVVRAPANDLYLALWHRRELSGLLVEGDVALFDDYTRLSAINWS